MDKPGTQVTLPPWLEDAIAAYLETDWSKQANTFGGLNAVAYIGERVVALYVEATGKRPIAGRKKGG